MGGILPSHRDSLQLPLWAASLSRSSSSGGKAAASSDGSVSVASGGSASLGRGAVSPSGYIAAAASRVKTTTPARGKTAFRGETASPSRSKAEPRLLVVDGLEVWVTRKRIKNAHLRVKSPSGRVEVSAPLRTSDDFVTSFVRAKRAWIDARIAAAADSPRGQAEEASPEEQAEWKALVSACVPLIVEKWEPILGVKAGVLAYRNMKSRWGSCQPSTGRICINTRLALYPPDCLEYVVVHELCHLLERGHGPRFYALMDAFLPSWRESRAKLRA